MESTPEIHLIYASQPSRIDHKRTEIMDFIAAEGHAGLHPFNALPYEYFEGNARVGRTKALEMCCKLIDVCDQLWLFGISEGTLVESQYFLDQNTGLARPKRLRVLVKEFDPEWERYYEIYQSRFEQVLVRLSL